MDLNLLPKLRTARALWTCASRAVATASAHPFGELPRAEADGRFFEWSRALFDDAQVRLEVVGREHLEGLPAAVFMSNHRSLFDIPAMALAVEPRTLRMLAKRELFRIPVWGYAMARAEMLPVSRTDRSTAIRDLELARAKMASGVSVWIAPEGTRSRDGRLGAFKKGGFVMALQAGVPIVPVAIAGTEAVVPRKTWDLYLGRAVVVRFGPPIDAGAYAPDRRDSLMTDVRSAMEALLGAAEARRAELDGRVAG
jgi:1-acyl-sn-glycerol-3-phosphate acyltransferase